MSGLAEPEGRQAAWPKAEANALKRPRPGAEEGHHDRTRQMAAIERISKCSSQPRCTYGREGGPLNHDIFRNRDDLFEK